MASFLSRPQCVEDGRPDNSPTKYPEWHTPLSLEVFVIPLGRMRSLSGNRKLKTTFQVRFNYIQLLAFAWKSFHFLFQRFRLLHQQWNSTVELAVMHSWFHIVDQCYHMRMTRNRSWLLYDDFMATWYFDGSCTTWFARLPQWRNDACVVVIIGYGKYQLRLGLAK